MLAITADDHIFYKQVGIAPKRKSPELGSYIKDGRSSDNDWVGFVRSEDRLEVIDPKSGWIVTCNNRPASSRFQGDYFNQGMFTARADRL